jgi:GNAT superfamily N-acetyltransferase
MLQPGFHPIPPGHVAAIVTHLRMDRPAAPPAAPELALPLVERPDPDWYRDLFRRVGGTDWLWTSRLRMDDDALRAVLHHPAVAIRVHEERGRAEGIVELDFRRPGTCELAFFGLTRGVQGRGLGRGMMRAALHHGFARAPEMTVHTCTFDSPVALPFYIRSGFVPVRQEVEIMADPRADGTLPEDAAPHIPRIG